MSTSNEPTALFDTILKSYLNMDLNAHHIISFNFLLEKQIKEVIAQYGKMTTLLEDVKYSMSVENVCIQPDEAHLSETHTFGQNYTLSVVGDIVLRTETIPDAIVYRMNTTIARLPLISGRTALSSSLDTDPYPFTGAFIVRGKLRTIPATKTVIWDVPIIMRKKNELFLQVRSRHPHKSFRSTSTIDFKVDHKKKPKSEGVILCRLAFQKSDLHISVVVQGLGCTPEKFNNILKMFAGSKYDRRIFCRYEMSMRHNRWSSQSYDVKSAEMCISRIYKKTLQSTGHNIINSETLPHIRYPENMERERMLKVIYLAHCVVMLILATHGKIPEEYMPLRDDFSQSQIQSSANHLGGLFRLVFIMHVRTCGKLLRRAIMKVPGAPSVKVGSVDIIKVFGEHRLSARIMSAVASGVWSPLRKGVSIALNNNNDDSVDMQLRRISSSLTTTDGTHTRPRNVMRDQFGFICASYTPDGDQTGLVYELAMTASISPPVHNRTALFDILIAECCDIFIDMEEVLTTPVTKHMTESSVFLMDSRCAIIGIVIDRVEFIRRFRNLRRNLSISPYTFISYHVITKILQVQQDEGFLCRPLIVAERMQSITPTTTFNEALRRGIVEYVNVREQQSLCLISISPKSTVLGVTTHVELTQASLLGMMCGSAPFVTAQQGPRNSYFGSQKKQAIIAGPKDRRGAISTTELWHSHRSLVSAKTERMIPGHDQLRATPLVLAFISLEGVEEDAVIFSKASAERGAMMASTTRTYQSEAPPPNSIFSEIFEKPGLVVSKKNVKYDGIQENGLPMTGTIINGGDVIIGKTRSIKKQIGKTALKQQKFMISRRDISSTSRLDETGTVRRSSISTLPTGTRAVVDVSTLRPLIIGDKLASRYAQKSVVSAFWSQENLPVSLETGMSPDIIASPLSLTSRMTMSSMIEAITGKAVAITGNTSIGIDEQEFDISNKEHIRKIGQILKENGFNSNGKERFMDGRTGKVIEGRIFVGVVDYLRLVHLASKKAHARSIGRRDCLTRQAKDGMYPCYICM